MTSQEAPFSEAHRFKTTHHQMIQESNLDKGQSVFESTRDLAVGGTGVGRTTRVIVCDDDSAGIVSQGALDHLTRMHTRTVDGAEE